MSSSDLSDCVRRTLNRYFRDLEGERPAAVYEMVLASVEKPMLEVIMKQAGGNQTVAADILGINRNTLRRKLTEHGLL
jgi:Fis family transcriptional regulator